MNLLTESLRAVDIRVTILQISIVRIVIIHCLIVISSGSFHIYFVKAFIITLLLLFLLLRIQFQLYISRLYLLILHMTDSQCFFYFFRDTFLFLLIELVDVVFDGFFDGEFDYVGGGVLVGDVAFNAS